MMIHGLGGMSSGLFIAFGIGRVLLGALFIYILYRAFKQYKVNNDPALEQLKMKFVNGEITEEEYLKKAEFLRK